MRAAGRLLERHRARDLERHFAGVDVVVGAVDQLHLHIDHRIAGENAVLERFRDSLLHRSDELTRDDTAHDLVLEDVALAGLGRLEVDHHVAVLTLAAGLANELALDLLDALANRLAIRDLRAADVCDVSGSVWTRNVGSSSESFWSAIASLSWSAFVFGSMATSMTGAGNFIASRMIGCSSSHSVSPVRVSFRLIAAAMSPARTSSISSRLFACIWSRRPTRSRLSFVELYTYEP